MNRTASCLLAFLLSLLATAAQAVPVSFRFSTVIQSASFGVPEVPPPFNDVFSILGTPITGSFTIETDVPSFPTSVFENGAFVPVGLRYLNPIVRYDLTVAGRDFSFISIRPSLGSGIRESGFTAIDLTAPRPSIQDDILQLDAALGRNHFGAPYEGVGVFASLIRQERDLSLIQSTDMLSGLTTPASWHFFFTLFNAQTPAVNFQVHGFVTNLQQVVAAPEPGTAGLAIVGFALLGLAMRRRHRP